MSNRSVAAIIEARSALQRGLVAERSSDVSVAALGLRRMGSLLDALGNPQRAYRTIHVAGSKGKGTTTYLAAAVLSEAGLRTGRYVSPHLFHWNERIAIDNGSISDTDFIDVLESIDALMVQVETRRPDLGTFNAFELLTAAAFLHFAQSGCDAAVVEVGLGGRFDSTNHLAPVATILTTIEDEHAEILGPDLSTIAWNKAGIMRAGVTTVVQSQSDVVLAVIESEGETTKSPVLLEGRDWVVDGQGPISVRADTLEVNDVRLRLPGRANASNLGAGLVAINRGFEDVDLSRELVNGAIDNLAVPGRFTVMRHFGTGQVFVLDGAHTMQSLTALGRAVQNHFGIERTTCVVNVLDDKRMDQVFAAIKTFADEVILPPATSVRSARPEILLAAAESAGIHARAAESLDGCLLMTRPDGNPVVVTGSFGIVGDAISILSVQIPRQQ